MHVVANNCCGHDREAVSMIQYVISGFLQTSISAEYRSCPAVTRTAYRNFFYSRAFKGLGIGTYAVGLGLEGPGLGIEG